MKILKAIRDLFNQKVLLCDLDWTIIVTKSGKVFPIDENDWAFKDGIKEAIQNYNPKYIFIISNQGGIEKGYINELLFRRKLRNIVSEIRTWGKFIVEGTYCPKNDPKCYGRKPNIGMVNYFRFDFEYGFSNRNALMIGDASGLPGQFSDTDLQCAKNAGIKYLDVELFIKKYKP